MRAAREKKSTVPSVIASGSRIISISPAYANA